MNYEYKNKYLWDAPVVWNKPADHFRMLVSLRTRTPWVSDAKLDLEKLINSPIGEKMIEDFLPYITYGDEMDPALLAYYEGLEKGLKKEMHQRDDFWERWATFVPLSTYREENRGRKYPLLFVLHGSTMPINWEECSGFTKVAAREEIILCIPENHSVENLMRIFGEMQRLYPIDLSRVYCTGYSLGGRQTNEMIFAHPEILAAACPCGALAGPFSCTDASEERIEKVVTGSTIGEVHETFLRGRMQEPEGLEVAVVTPVPVVVLVHGAETQTPEHRRVAGTRRIGIALRVDLMRKHFFVCRFRKAFPFQQAPADEAGIFGGVGAQRVGAVGAGMTALSAVLAVPVETGYSNGVVHRQPFIGSCRHIERLENFLPGDFIERSTLDGFHGPLQEGIALTRICETGVHRILERDGTCRPFIR